MKKRDDDVEVVYYRNSHVKEDSTDKWYLSKDPYNAVIAAVNQIESLTGYVSSLDIRNARLYSDAELLGMQTLVSGQSRATAIASVLSNKITYNVIKSCIDTIVNKIGKNKPKVTYLTQKSNWSQQIKAKNLSKYIEGRFYEMNAYQKGLECLRDACVFGTGWFKIYVDGEGKFKADRVLTTEMRIDPSDGLYGEPKEIHQVKYISRDVLLREYPEKKESIMFANTSTDSTTSADLVKVIESWRLKGRHTICIDTCTLVDEKYEEDWFPFVNMRWSKRLIGFFGQGLAEELTGFQIEINKILKNISDAIGLVAVPRVYLENGSNVSAAAITNKIGSIIKYQGGTRPPIFETPTAMSSEVYTHVKWLIQSAYEKSGISQLSATSKKPAGIESGVAIREYNDIETERFITLGMAYEDFFLNIADIIKKISTKMYKDDPNQKVNVKTSDFIDSIKWSDMDMEDDQFFMKPYPTSLLPTSPAGRLQKVQELIDAGWVSKEQALSLLDFPDLEQFKSLTTSSEDIIHSTLSKIIDSGKYYPPEPRMNLKLAVELSSQYYLRGRVDGMDEESLRLLLQFQDDADRLSQLSGQLDVAPAAPTAVEGQAPMPTQPISIA